MPPQIDEGALKAWQLWTTPPQGLTQRNPPVSLSLGASAGLPLPPSSHPPAPVLFPFKLGQVAFSATEGRC